MGIGTSTIESYWSGYTVLKVGYNNSIFGNTADSVGSAVFISQNLYSDASNYRYVGSGSDEGGLIDLRGGAFVFSNAPLGTAGNVASIVPRLTISSGGDVELSKSLTVQNGSDPIVTVSDTDSNYRGSMRWLSSSNVLEFFTRYAGTYYTNNLVLDRGNVGIGTDSPDKALVVNHSADGNLITFEKDEALVGAIGTFSGVPYIGYQVGAGGGIMFNGLNIEPTGLGTARTTGTNNLGSNNYKFKDIYISDGIYFNSNSSNNHLDAYEEGTFTPTIKMGIDTLSSGTTTGIYTRVGNLVSIFININDIVKSGSGNDLTIEGLPYASKTGTNCVIATRWGGIATSAQLSGFVSSGTSRINFQDFNTGGYNYLITQSQLSSTFHIYSLSVTYQV